MTETADILVAVDGGGTGCRAAVGTPAQGISGRAKGGPANIHTDFDGALRNIMQAVTGALDAAGWGDLPREGMTAGIGVAGGNGADLLAQARATLPFRHCHMTGDRQTTAAGVLGEADGFVIALGTGTIVARQKDLAVQTVSGWGFHLSDQASGAWLGQRVLAHCLQVGDGMEPATELTRQTMQRMGDNLAMFTFSGTAEPKDYAELAPMVVAAARADDPLALSLLQDGARYLEKALDALGFQPGDRLSLSGGLGPVYDTYLSERYTRNLMPPEGTALDGAFALAKRLHAGQ